MQQLKYTRKYRFNGIYNLSLGTQCRIDGETRGVCLIKEDCSAYMDLYTSLLTIENINFLRELQCENLLYPDETVVCCPQNASEYR